MNIIENLNKIINEKNIPIVRIAEKSGLSRQHITRVLKNETNVGIESLQSICEACNISLNDLIDKTNTNTNKIPVLGTIPAGIPIEAIKEIIDYEEITNEMAKQGEFFGLKVRGDSMSPNIKDKDVLIVRKQEDAESGDICVVMVNGNDATVKRIKKDAIGITLIPDNQNYNNMYYSNSEILSLPVRIIGKVVEIRRSL